MAREYTRDGITLERRIRPPFGSNNSSAIQAFTQRKYYKDQVYPNHFIAPWPLDLWYDRHLFGKIDTQGYPIYADNSKLKQLSGDDSNIFALDFVVDAFNDFKSHFLYANRGSVEGTPFALLEPARGTTQVLKKYDTWMDTVYNIFANDFMARKKRDDKLINFDSFIKLFRKFIYLNYKELPFTLSQYILSPKASPSVSGLIIDISLDGHGDDFSKYKNFISDQRNFLCYVNSAQEYGFKIDKNFPGRLIADINSPAIKKYMEVYPKAPEPFTLEEPIAPVPNPPSPPQQVSDNPWQAGDPVEFIVMWPNDTAGGGTENSRNTNLNAPMIILKDHSEVLDRLYPPGQKSKTVLENVRVGNGMRFEERNVNLLKFLVSNFKSQHFTPILYQGEMINPAPTERLIDNQGNQGYPPDDPNADPVAIVSITTAYLLESNLQRGNGVWSGHYGPELFAARNYIGADHDFVKSSTSRIVGANRNYISQVFQAAGEGAHRVHLEVPLNAIHMSSVTNVLMAQRFFERATYHQRYEAWEHAVENYHVHFENTRQRDYNRLYAGWLERKEASEVAEDIYNAAPQLTTNNVINQRMIRSSDVDIFLLKQICMQFYHSYVSRSPIASPTVFTSCDDHTIRTRKKVVYREQISTDHIENKYSDSYWLDQYIHIRHLESGIKLPKPNFNKCRKHAQTILKETGLSQAAAYINKKFQNLILTNDLKRDKITDNVNANNTDTDVSGY